MLFYIITYELYLSDITEVKIAHCSVRRPEMVFIREVNFFIKTGYIHLFGMKQKIV